MLYPAVVRSLEQYDPARVLVLIETTREIAGALRPLIGNRLRETPTTVQIERGRLSKPPIVPYEAAAALAMTLIEDHGGLTVHFVGVPPVTADLLIKCVPPETLARFGGAARYAAAIGGSEPGSIRDLLLGRRSRSRAAE
jgi:L-seryl-tRNA(Ser) seleniumtransferase